MAGVVALNLQASQELGMTPEGLVEGSKILDAVQRVGAIIRKKLMLRKVSMHGDEYDYSLGLKESL